MKNFRIMWMGLLAVFLAGWMNTAAAGEESGSKTSKKAPAKIDDKWYDLTIDIACGLKNQKCKATGNTNLVYSFAKKFEFNKACKRSEKLKDVAKDLDGELREKASKLSKDVCLLMRFWAADATGKTQNQNTWEIVQKRMHVADALAKEGIANARKFDEALSHYQNINKTGHMIEDDEVMSIASIRLAEIMLQQDKKKACTYFDKIKDFAKSHLKSKGAKYETNFEKVNSACGN